MFEQSASENSARLHSTTAQIHALSLSLSLLGFIACSEFVFRARFWACTVCVVVFFSLEV